MTIEDDRTAMQGQILIVEDDVKLAALTADYLARNHYGVDVEHRGDTAVERIIAERPDIVILDIMLPGQNGFDICKAVRPHFEGVILVVTANDDDLDQVLGLELGADDYIAKPVSPRVLLARIRALQRRLTPSTATASDILSFGALIISPAERDVHLRGDRLGFSTAEFDLLWLLASQAGIILSRDDVLKALRGIGYDGLDRSIDVRISRIRRKLGDDPEDPQLIKTVRGKGYMFVARDWD